MSFLNCLSRQPLPVNLTQQDKVDRGPLLREAGLVSALRVQRAEGQGAGVVLRVLAITSRGRCALRAHL